MLLTLWINAFIPRTVAGYTIAMTRGRHGGKTAIPLPGSARLNPFNTFKAWNAGYLTDQRSFDNNPAASVRMRSIATIMLTPPNAILTSATHFTSGTTEVDTDSGDQIDFGYADMTRCRWGTLQNASFVPVLAGTVNIPFAGNVPVFAGERLGGTPTFKLDVVGAAADPLVSTAADIDYTGTFTIVILSGSGSTPSVQVEFQGMLDAFPAFEAYARLDGVTKTLFTSPPPAGNTVVNLLGPANRPIAGRAIFP